MLTHGNISFILIVDQKECMVVANDNTHTISQRIEIILVHNFLSSTIHVICVMVTWNLIFGILVYMFFAIKSSCKYQSQNLISFLVI